MILTAADIAAFADAWKCAFDDNLTPQQAEAEANRLIHFYMMLAKHPIDVRSLLPPDHDTMAA